MSVSCIARAKAAAQQTSLERRLERFPSFVVMHFQATRCSFQLFVVRENPSRQLETLHLANDPDGYAPVRTIATGGQEMSVYRVNSKSIRIGGRGSKDG